MGRVVCSLSDLAIGYREACKQCRPIQHIATMHCESDRVERREAFIRQRKDRWAIVRHDPVSFTTHRIENHDYQDIVGSWLIARGRCWSRFEFATFASGQSSLLCDSERLLCCSGSMLRFGCRLLFERCRVLCCRSRMLCRGFVLRIQLL